MINDHHSICPMHWVTEYPYDHDRECDDPYECYHDCQCRIIIEAEHHGHDTALIEAIKVIEDLKNKPGAHEEHYITAIKLLMRKP